MKLSLVPPLTVVSCFVVGVDTGRSDVVRRVRGLDDCRSQDFMPRWGHSLASKTLHPLISASTFSSQYVMPISRYIVVAAARCSWAC